VDTGGEGRHDAGGEGLLEDTGGEGLLTDTGGEGLLAEAMRACEATCHICREHVEEADATAAAAAATDTDCTAADPAASTAAADTAAAGTGIGATAAADTAAHGTAASVSPAVTMDEASSLSGAVPPRGWKYADAAIATMDCDACGGRVHRRCAAGGGGGACTRALTVTGPHNPQPTVARLPTSRLSTPASEAGSGRVKGALQR